MKSVLRDLENGGHPLVSYDDWVIYEKDGKNFVVSLDDFSNPIGEEQEVKLVYKVDECVCGNELFPQENLAPNYSYCGQSDDLSVFCYFDLVC
ncbi:MAG: hypothetical protein RSC93_08520 [Erysipelotrichaceae bacterium]